MFAFVYVRKVKMFVFLVLLGTSNAALGPPLNSFGVGNVPKCEPSVTTAGGSYAAHKGKFILLCVCEIMRRSYINHNLI